MNNTRLTAFFLMLLPFALNAVDVVVTASRIEEDSSTVPAIVTVIDEEDLEDEATVISALEKVPQVNVTSTIPGAQSLSMGGYTDNGYSRVLILVDGIPVNRPDMSSFNWLSLPLEKVERIEIIQGGASALYGDQAVAGVINIITRNGEKSTVTVKAGVDTRRSHSQSLTGQYNRKDFSLFSSVSRTDTKSSRDQGDYSMWNVTLTPSVKKELFSLSAEIYYTPSEYEMPGGLSEADYNENPDQSTDYGDLDTYEGVSYGVNVNTSVEFGDLMIKVPLSLMREDVIVDMDSSAFYSSHYDKVLTDIGVRPQGVYEFWLGDSRIEGIAGFDGNYTSIETDTFTGTNHGTPDESGTTSRYILSPWLQLEYSWQDLFLVESGIRYSYSRVEGETTTDLKTDEAESPFVYSGGITWLPLAGLKTFVSYDYVYRLPLLDEQVSFYGSLYDALYELDPEYGHSVNAGVEAFGESWKVSLAPFYSYMTDEIYLDPVTFLNVNGDSRERLGVNLSGTYKAGIFDLGAGYTYVNATYALGANKGNRVTLVSPHKVTGTVKVNLPLGFALSADGVYYSSYYQSGDEANEQDQIEGRNNLGAKVSWTSDFGLSLSVYGDNLMDCRTPAYVYYDSWSGSSWYPSEGRVFGVQAAWTY